MVEKKATAKKTGSKKTATKLGKKLGKKKSKLSKKLKKNKSAFTGKYLYAVGRRKEASARVRIYPEAKKSKGEIIINGKKLEDYFPKLSNQLKVLAPLKAAGEEKGLAIEVRVVGGGKTGQADAVRHGIARALLEYDPNLRKVLKAEGFLTRDPRVKERKKPGLRGARRSPQWSKR